MNRTATLAIALMIAPVALLRPGGDGARASDDGLAAVTPADQEAMDAWLAALNEGMLSRLDGVVADSVRVDGRLVPRSELRRLVGAWRASARSREARARPLVSEGRVVGLWTWSEDAAPVTAGAAPAPERVHWLGADFLRLEQGRIVEAWFHANRLGLGTSGGS